MGAGFKPAPPAFWAKYQLLPAPTIPHCHCRAWPGNPSFRIDSSLAMDARVKPAHDD
jgi:hypothetical protein